ncbi:glycine N-acyltransferase-like protein Keg1 [Haliotis rufescens]|uniref:glycine N-acyltransferase-like protein Keg1 n=1 Tax=Haliotis rufescens TaxID=6454 RepID=UPI00201E8151|nr:glycine N-acyltransferase-like protein Keg1 [Haliotis rufescens]
MAVFLADHKLPELRDRIQHKPRYFKIYNEVITKLDSVVTGFDFVVDKWPDFKAVITKPNPEIVEFEFLNNIYNVAAEDEKALSELLEQQGVINWSQGIVFACVDTTFSKVINEAIKCHGGSSDPSEPCYIQCVTQESLNVKPVPNGFKLLPLTQDDSKLVNTEWKFTGGNESLAYINKLITCLPSCCLYDPDGIIVGFAMSYHYGALGMLHVMEEHRGKGYAKVIMSHLAQKRLQTGKEAFIVIEESNAVSLKVHEGLGFKHVPNMKVVWIRYTPKGTCKGPKSCCI